MFRKQDDGEDVIKRSEIRIVGPAGLSRADLMYKWEVCETFQSRGNVSERCCLCHTGIRAKQRVRKYKEGKRVYSVHEGCFFTYFDIIHAEPEVA